jgi:type 1 glutamine amidotransferase
MTPRSQGEFTVRKNLLTVLAVLFGSAFVADGAAAKEVRVLVITGDEVSAHKWKETAPLIKKILTDAGHKVDVTQTPAKDLTPKNLARYDVFVLNYRNTPAGAKENPDSVWSEENKKAFLDAVKGGKGLYVHHFSSSAFTGTSDFDKQYEKMIAGGWRKQGNHGKMHEFTVAVRKKHPITEGLSEFKHGRDELYQNSLMLPGSEVLAMAYSDKSVDPRNTGKDEPILWVARYGKGRVCNNVLGHDTTAMKGKYFQTLLVRGVEWAATGKVTHPVPAKRKGE